MERPAELPVDQKDQVGHRENTRNVVIFGESGVGKSSLINMIAGHEVAKTSSSGMGCTFQSSRYRMPITGEMFHVWDTAGLDEGIYGRVPAEMAERYLAKKLVRDLWPINPGSSRAGYAPNSEVHLRSPAEGLFSFI
ncbi:hypothetical protein BS17DRAFT_175542 [Gyrodon lividus]|nr:hypothetical protein BS17DRAFT_175542 [Gyrodon lividus]